MLKLLYLVAGLLLKQVVDELKEANKESIADLKKRHESFAEYRENLGLEKGSPEAIRAIAQAQHAHAVAPTLAKIGKQIRFRRWLPTVVYTVLLIIVCAVVIYFEGV